MPVIKQTFLSVVPDGASCAQANEIIGAIKTMLLNDVNWTVISDNNPTGASTPIRELILKYGDCMHYYKFLSSSNGDVKTSLRNLANTGDSAFRSTSNYNNKTVKLLYGVNGMVSDSFRVTGYPLAYVKCSNGSFYAYTSAGNLYVNDSDLMQSPLGIPLYPNAVDASNNLILGKVALYISNTLYGSANSLWANQFFVAYTFYSDGIYNYYSTMDGVAMSDNP